MDVSVGIIPRARFSEPGNLDALARGAENGGLRRIWLGDRLVYPVRYESAGDLGATFPWNPAAPQLEGVVAMTWLLAHTERVGVGVQVLVLPLRQPVVLARQLASMDHLSSGRLSLGVGVGGVLEEFDAVGVDRARRGARADEYIEAMLATWSEERPSFNGEFVSFPEIYSSPKPMQPGGPPLWIGGHTDATLDRVARYGTGLAPGGVTPDRARSLLADVRARAEARGRDPSGIGILVMTSAPDRNALVRLLEAHRDAGTTEVIVPAQGRTPEEIAENVAGIGQLLA